MTRILTPLRVEAYGWLILYCGLLTGIGMETDWGQRWTWPVTPLAEQTAEFPKPELTSPYTIPSPDTLMETSLRPLFVGTRRPAPTLPTSAPKPTMKRDQFILTGTTIVPEGKFAHLIEKASNKSHVVAEGKEVNGILVKTVLPEQAVLSQYDDIETLILRAPVTTPGGQPKP